MVSKTISLKDETYRRLKAAKAEDESFSDVVDRLLEADEEPLRALVGLLDEAEIETLRSRSAAFRATVDSRMAPANDG